MTPRLHDQWEAAPSAPKARPAWLATAVDAVAGSRGNHLDRLVVAVVGYLQGDRARYVPPSALLERWPWPSTKPTAKALLTSVRRLAERRVLVHRDGGYRVDRELQRAAADRGARFRWLEVDFASDLSNAAVDLLGLLRGRQHGRNVPWADSNEHLAELLGTDERAVRRSMDELRAAGRVETVGSHRLRTGHHLPVLAVREHTVPPATSGNACPVARNACPVAGNACPTISTQSQDLASLGSSPLPRAMASPTPSREPEPPSAAQSRASGADDPTSPEAQRSQPSAQPASLAPIYQLPTPRNERQGSYLAECERREQAATDAMRSWGSYFDHLRAAVARLHMSPSTAGGVHDALIAAGVRIMPHKISGPGQLVLRRKREQLAESLAVQGAMPSEVLEAAYILAMQIRMTSGQPHKVGAALRVLIEPKAPDYVGRNHVLVEEGGGGLPMAAGIDALRRLIQPQNRQIGEFAYPAKWWHSVVGPELLDRIASLRMLAGEFLAVKEAESAAGAIGGGLMRKALAERNESRSLDRTWELKVALAQAARAGKQLIVQKLVVELTDLGVPRTEIERFAGVSHQHRGTA